MTREELEKEAEMFVSEKADKGNFDVEKFGKAYFSESSMKQALVKFAEPREKRIVELENQIADIKANCDLAIEGRDIKIKELEQELTVQKDQHQEEINLHLHAEEYIKSLEEENAELKKKLKERLKTIADKDLSFVAKFDALESENAELKEKIRLQNEQEAKDIRARFAY